MTVPKRVLPRLTSVRAGRALRLRLTWDTGLESDVDIRRPIQDLAYFEPLRDDAALFRQVRLGELGTDVVWPNGLDMSADLLWRLSQEQLGITISADQFRLWREQRHLTLDGLADALGISRRMVAYYESGEKPVPRVVALAIRALAQDL